MHGCAYRHITFLYTAGLNRAADRCVSSMLVAGHTVPNIYDEVRTLLTFICCGFKLRDAMQAVQKLTTNRKSTKNTQQVA